MYKRKTQEVVMWQGQGEVKVTNCTTKHSVWSTLDKDRMIPVKTDKQTNNNNKKKELKWHCN